MKTPQIPLIGGTPRQVSFPPEAFFFCIKEVLRTPGVKQLNFIQTPIILDAMGGPNIAANLASANNYEVQTFTPENLLPEHAKNINIPKNCGFAFEVFGTVPRPLMPAPGSLYLRLCQLRKEAGVTPSELPLLLVWTEFNIETFEYKAINNGPPLIEMARGPGPQLVQ